MRKRVKSCLTFYVQIHTTVGSVFEEIVGFKQLDLGFFPPVYEITVFQSNGRILFLHTFFSTTFIISGGIYI